MSLYSPASREQARAERTKAETQAQIELANANSLRRQNENQAQIELRAAREEADRARRRQAKADKLAEQREKRKESAARSAARRRVRDEQRARRAERRTQRTARLWAKVTTLAANGSELASTVVYTVALAAAMGGQISTAKTQLGDALPLAAWLSIGIVIAIFVEGAAVAAATTAHRIRLAGGRPVMASVFTWVFAAVAAGIQWYGHQDQAVLAVVLMSATLTAVAVHEMQTRAKATIKQIKKTRAPIRWGWRRWLVAPGQTARAWRADILSRTTIEAAALLADAERTRLSGRADKLRRRAVRDGQELVELTIVVDTTTADSCTYGDCPAVPGQYGCPGHLAWNDRTPRGTGKADTDTTADPDASDSGLVVPIEWLDTHGADTPPDVSALLSALTGPVALLDADTAVDGLGPDSGQVPDTDADTSTEVSGQPRADTIDPDATSGQSHHPDADTTSGQVPDTDADTSTEVSGQPRADTVSGQPSRSLRRPRRAGTKGKPDAASEKDIEEAYDTYFAEHGEAPTSRKLAEAVQRTGFLLGKSKAADYIRVRKTQSTA